MKKGVLPTSVSACDLLMHRNLRQLAFLHDGCVASGSDAAWPWHVARKGGATANSGLTAGRGGGAKVVSGHALPEKTPIGK